MTSVPQKIESEEASTKGLFLIGGTIKEVITTAEPSAVRDHLSSLLQVKNLVVLLGSGASFHLGSPQTRNLTNKQVVELIQQAGGTPSASDAALLATINPTDNGDLERLLNGLQLAAALASQAGQDEVTIGSGTEAVPYPKDQVEGLRQRINRALAEACRLPKPGAKLPPPFDTDPLIAHRTFLSRIVRSRRANLPRPRIFTTNYDLVVESALDELGYPYIDGFSGTVDRRLNLAFYGLDFHRVETTTQSVVARAEGALYLHKVHGSLNWRSSTDRDRLTGLESLEVKQSAAPAEDDELVLIYPTSAKEGDTLAYPYSDLLRLLGDAVQQEDTAVLVAGYGFADPHINRLLLRSLATNAALNVFVADPFAVLDDADMASLTTDAQQRPLTDVGVTPKSTAIAALATASDSRIAVLTGDHGKFSQLAKLMPNSSRQGEAPAAVASLIEALEQAARGSAPPIPVGETL
ncbi:SIR2 family protein [Sanguibacter sp. 25GB23B1]|uniref:SIR2 family protein n=1 Tax=unclassified Sanguibacter TaxID=2645534 RepID=UPI0032AECF5B